MLDSVLLQLESADRSICIDAYANLCGTLKAYKDTPSIHALRARIGSLLKYIRRDIQWKARETGDADTNLVTQALKVLVFLIWNTSLTVLLTDEYRTFILEQALQAIERTGSPKAVLLHYLHLLATQDFRANIMTTGRASRLLDCLDTVTDKVRSNGVACERLMVYSRLLDQAKPVMKSKAGWIEHLLSGLLSPSKDARSKSIALGTKAAQALDGSSTFSSACQQALDRGTQDKMTFSSLACRKLRNMVKSNEDAAQVPQIWAVVMLLQRGSKTRLEKRDSFKEWLIVIQSCFNCNDSATRVQANLAWNRLIYVIPLRETTDATIIKMLIKPITSQLERPVNEKPGKGSRVYATSSLCMLLYYALRPSGSSVSFDLFWDAFVLKTFNEQYLSNVSNADNACRMMMAMCWSSKSKIWRENRANEPGIVEPEELPVVDCKWLRSRSKKVMPVFRKLFKFASWGAGKPDQAFVGIAWKHFCLAIGDACRKEVKPSPDTLQTISSFLGLLQSIRTVWLGASDTVSESEYGESLARFHFVVNCLVIEIGPIPFTEALFHPNESGLITPSHALPQSSGHRNIAAVEAILQVVCRLPDGSNTNHVDDSFVKILLQAFVESRCTLTSLLPLYRLCAVWTTVQKPKYMSIEPKLVWKLSADLGQQALDARRLDKVRGNLSALDFQPSDVVAILSAGLSYDSAIVSSWRDLLVSLLSVVEQADGQISILRHVLEPLSGFLIAIDTDTAFRCSSCLLVVSLAPGRWRDVASILDSDTGSRLQRDGRITQSCQSLAYLANKQLATCYSKSSFEDMTELVPTIHACADLLTITPISIIQKVLPWLTDSLSLWWEDRAGAFVNATEVGSSKSIAARKLCSSILDLIKRLSKKGMAIDDVKKLLMAGLKSTHEVTVNKTVATLEEIFDDTSASEYPSCLRTTLADLRVVDDFGVPELPTTSRTGDQESCRLLDTEEDGLVEEFPELTNALPLFHKLASSRLRKESPPPSPSTPKTHCLSSARRRANTRLRHDDSQVQYTIIESSPVAAEPDSQALTENQKSVRERQRTEPATTFSDFKSSPVLNVNKQPLIQTPMRMKINVAERATLAMNEPTTPTLPEPQTDDLDDVMPSSPTPSSKSQELRLSEIDVPSSPPAELNTIFNPTIGPFKAQMDDSTGRYGPVCTNDQLYENSAALTLNSTRDVSPHIINDRTSNRASSPLDISRSTAKDIRVPNEKSESALTFSPASNITSVSSHKTSRSSWQEDRTFEDRNPVLTTTSPTAPEAGLDNERDLGFSIKDAQLDQRGNDSLGLLTGQQIYDVSKPLLKEPEEPQMGSDDADFLSASQLEHELNSTSVDEVDQHSSDESQLYLSIDQSPSIRSQCTRAEPVDQVDQTSPASPREDSRQAMSHPKSIKPNASTQVNAEAEILDCIMVDSKAGDSHLTHSFSGSSAMTQTPSRKRSRARGRKRKSLDEPFLTDGIEVQISPNKKLKSTSKLGDDEIVDESEAFPEQRGNLGNETGNGIAQNDNSACKKETMVDRPNSSAAIPTNQNREFRLTDHLKWHLLEADITRKVTSEPGSPQVGTPSPTTGTAVLANLQTALGSLNSGSISMRELRDIEDALFKIRVQAQKTLLSETAHRQFENF